MLDIKFIRENAQKVEESAQNKGYKVEIKKLLEVDKKRRDLIGEVDKLRSKRKEIAQKRDEKQGQKLKKELKRKEDELEDLNEDFYKLIREVPNLAKEDVPIGKDESQNKTIREVGRKTQFNFKPKDHLELGEGLDLIDIERSSKISGSRQSFIKNELVTLEFALIKFAFEILNKEGFVSIIPPVIINKKAVEGLGYVEYERGEGYKLDDQYLVGTSEHSVVPMHMDETLDVKNLPRRYAAFSTSFRKEAGSWGKDTRGIFRLHQFDKIEMVSIVNPKDEEKELEFLLSLEEKLVKALEIPYQVVEMCTGDLGFPTAKKYDIECWMPGQNKYRETHSVSTTTDFQARRLNIKYRNGDQTGFVHILNGTAFAIGRTLIAIMENYQQKDGTIEVPKALQKYTGFSKIPS
ncbi:serine--tRNA ligase [Candidatus Curtissbacteria bacterium RIFCSPLOWO2_02_FULL_40_11]|uniref:Serine--tRNA ligase n=2 Tax=Candidatus Curtissiibacteriota TaxID=1752717 RepID=A0A1F5I7G8_9BACT|nr:MAG: serine--tRNA ligase [Candidatus Curtissbacteria bacterium RIFCSPLOWO2_02_FULL_40_11]OGE12333.1 MAG: serine--tRNA ligase [Candidatus Curtissbacteria bacterium RIFCSPLOWO2_12_FULL_38_9]